jgi:ankyrin repeat protein
VLIFLKINPSIIRTLEKASWWTDSHTAVINNRLDDIQNFEYQSSPITPLDLAIMIGNLNAVEYLIERGSRSTSSPTLFISSNGTNFDINDCLNKAIKAKRNEIAMFLLEKGADPQAIKQLGQNSLHIACYYGDINGIKILVEFSRKKIAAQSIQKCFRSSLFKSRKRKLSSDNECQNAKYIRIV